jgi:acetate kinase
MPEKAYLYALPYELYKDHHIRKYGFHGTSHKYVSMKAAEAMGKDIKELKIVNCHLGNGASVSAVKNGESVDTSMGFTPLQGLVMGTRTGDMDPAVVTYLIKELGYSASEVDDILNKKSGVLGVSGVSSDFRDVEDAAWNKKEHRSNIALDMFVYRVKQYIGSYAAIMGGVDAIVFTAGVGENSVEMRESILEGFDFLGVDFDKDKNKVRGKFAEITKEGSKVKAFVIPTNEELMIAKDTLDLV